MAYSAKRLNNWELPKWYPPMPRHRKGHTRFIANDRGHLVSCDIKKLDSACGNFRNTYQLPNRITRKFAEEYNECLLQRGKWSKFPKIDEIYKDFNKDLKCPNKCDVTKHLLKFDKMHNYQFHPCEKKQPGDFEYIPGDFTSYQQQHPSRQLLLDDKYNRDHNIEADLPLNKLYLADADHMIDHLHHKPYRLPQTAGLVNSNISPRQPEEKSKSIETDKKYTYHSITEKPNEHCPSPVIPAYANFELAKRMHQSNLDHQPLPDCIADAAYRKSQITGGHAGLALQTQPVASGIGVKTYQAGPTHCTKMKVYRPKTFGSNPNAMHSDKLRALSAPASNKKQIAPIDLAIRWDYKPVEEPIPPKRIDGSNGSSGPAVFAYVKSPRKDKSTNIGYSSGVFNNTLGESSFFDKDLLKRKLDFSGRKLSDHTHCNNDCIVQRTAPLTRSASHERRIQPSNNVELGQKRFGRQYKSVTDILNDPEYRILRDRYLSEDCCGLHCTPPPTSPPCKHTGFFSRAKSKFCPKVAPQPQCCYHNCLQSAPREMPISSSCKAAFRAGVPHYNASGDICNASSHCNPKVLVVPQPRKPYIKRNYNIGTLVPPFKSHAGGAKDGGYPEHWRLASVYQHAFKPMQCRKRALLQTVYK